MRPIGRATRRTVGLGAFCGGLALSLWVGACSRINPEEPVERTPQACCTWGDFRLQNFKGCRIPTRDCRSSKGERYWMRGYVTCGAVDEANCDGGRCCSYKPQYDEGLAEPIENWKPPGFAEPTNNITPPPGEAPAADPAPAPATPEAPAADPAPPAAAPDAPAPPAAEPPAEKPAAPTAPKAGSSAAAPKGVGSSG
jgi:hypothetical protein